MQELAAANASLVDNSGAAVPLTSQSALDILCEPDPWFYGTLCPGGKCLGYASITEALGDWGVKRGYGMLYLEGSFDGSENVYIDGSSGMHPEFLTLRGIVQDTTTVGIPKLNGGIDVSSLTGGFTIQGIDIDGHLNFYVNRGLININRVNINQSGAPFSDMAYGIRISSHAGPVTLNQVVVENTTNYGVWIDNTFGEIPTGAVTITNLTVLNNSGGVEYPDFGLKINTMSPININGIYLKYNVGGGVIIQNNGATVTIKNGYIGFSQTSGTPYSGNGLTILGIPYKGNITLENLRIYDNEYIGILIDSVGLVTLKNVYSNGNDDEGLYIEGNFGTASGASGINYQ